MTVHLYKKILMILISMIFAINGTGSTGRETDAFSDSTKIITEVTEDAAGEDRPGKSADTDAETHVTEKRADTGRSEISVDNAQADERGPVEKEAETAKEPEVQAEETVAKEETTKAAVPEQRPVSDTAVIHVSEGSKETQHVHSWQAETEGIWHDPVTETKWVTDMQAYDETVTRDEPVYEQVRICVASCRGCGRTYSGEDYGSVIDECQNHILADHNNACGYGLEQSYYDTRITGYDTVTETIHHEEEGHWETVTVSEGYEETLITGYVCTGCGARK